MLKQYSRWMSPSFTPWLMCLNLLATPQVLPFGELGRSQRRALGPWDLISSNQIVKVHRSGHVWTVHKMTWILKHILTKKTYTSTGRKFAIVEGLSHDLESVPDRFFMFILRGRCGTVKLSPRFKSNKLRRHSGGEICPESCWQKDFRGKGWLNKHNVSPASVGHNFLENCPVAEHF